MLYKGVILVAYIENNTTLKLTFTSGRITENRSDTVKRSHCHARLDFGIFIARSRCDQVSARLGLPPGVDNGRLSAAYDFMEPGPRGDVDWFTDTANRSNSRQIVLLHMTITLLQ